MLRLTLKYSSAIKAALINCLIDGLINCVDRAHPRHSVLAVALYVAAAVMFSSLYTSS